MALSAGTKLGPYEITGAIGAGGMGEVYRARDTRLGRDVAIKVLPQRLVENAEAKQRFEREARAVSSLNCPHICTLYDIGHQEGTDFLVMELVEGETLAKRLEKGPLPAPDLLRIAIEIADALEKAHRQGVVHRDLKPGNIMLTKSGAKLMDFGLAKSATEGASAAAPVSSLTQSLNAPHAATAPLTARGTIVGTFQYMAPEQMEGKEAEARSDIFSFGAVLFEMATGKRAFEGKTTASVIAAILEREPPAISSIQPMSPPALDRVVRICLAKDPDERFQSAHDVKLQLEWIRDAGSQAGLPAPVAAQRKNRERMAWATAAVLAIIAAIFAYGFIAGAPQATHNAPMELGLDIPSNQQLFSNDGPAVILSPDSSRIAYVVQTSSGANQIYVRELDKSEARALEGAEGGSPFFSPDGQWIAFYSGDGELEKVSVFGGAPVALCSAVGSRGGSWGKDGTIIFTQGFTDPLYRVSADGGTPSPVTHLDKSRNETTQRWPQILPGGKAVLFTASADNNNFDRGYVEAASLASGNAKVLVQNAYFGRYLSSGYLTYVSGGTLFAAPFDAKNLKLTGTAMPILPNLQADLTDGSAQISVSQTGTAVYISGATLSSQVIVSLFDKKGATTPLIKQPGDYYAPAFSPDGKRLALQVGGSGNISIYDIARGTMTPVTFAAAGCIRPIWTPDSKMITCNRTGGGLGISWLPSDGTGRLEPLTKGIGVFQYPSSWSLDGKTLAFSQVVPKTGICCEIVTLPVSPNGHPGQPRLLLGEGGSPEISPDGQWLAYQSHESGVSQIYVVPFPELGGKWQISVTDGEFPRWSRVGHELFFLGQTTISGGTSALFEVPYTAQGSSFQAGKAEILFRGGFEVRNPSSSYDVAPDGKHFAMLAPAGGSSSAPARPTVVINWFNRVAQLVAAGQK